MPQKQHFEWSSTSIKRFACVFMAVDHFAKSLYFLLVLSPMTDGWTSFPMGDTRFQLAYLVYRLMVQLGTVAFPLFAFCAAEGVAHTHSRPRYLLRLVVLGLVSQPVYVWLFSLVPIPRDWNVLFTLSCGVVSCWLWDLFSDRPIPLRWLAAAVPVFAAELLNFDYGGIGCALVLVFYLFRQRPRERALSGTALCGGIMFRAGRVQPLRLLWLAILPHYSGDRGNGSKWGFYLFYPLHLLALLLLCHFLA